MDSKPEIQRHTQTTMLEAYSGPLPPADDFERYENVHPGSARIILEMAEREQKHRHEAETATIMAETEDMRATHFENKLALGIAAFVTMSFLALGFILTMHGHDAVGGIMMGTSLVGIIGAILKNKRPS